MAMRRTGIMHPLVDYDYSLPALIERIFDSKGEVNPEITEEKFPVKGTGEANIEIVLLTPEQDLTTGQVLKEIRDKRQRPARLEEVLALEYFIRFGEFLTFMSFSKGFVFVALGSPYPERGSLPVLYTTKRGLVLDLFDPSQFWTKRDCFPVVGQ